ncbi:MAG TPA: TlpA disulfide reductase family protein [Candidatus Polarisedimenticolia bacterium]|nr:TlpA disulfide reductase family protein [Candidatus Polarisedimenticolia bacterium]
MALLLATLLPAGAGTALAQKKPTLENLRGHRVGDRAFDFKLPDLEGQVHHLSDLVAQGKVVHVVFWATWCVPCIEEIPRLREAYTGFHQDGLEILGIAVDLNETRDGARAFAADYKINYPILWDAGGATMSRYGVSFIPQNFLIDRDGVIRFAGTSLPNDYAALLRKLLQKGDTAPAAAR